MTQQLNITFNGLTTNPFDDWYEEEKGTGEVFELESDVDEIEEDLDFNDPESY